jgi:hypothetical protein
MQMPRQFRFSVDEIASSCEERDVEEEEEEEEVDVEEGCGENETVFK